MFDAYVEKQPLMNLMAFNSTQQIVKLRHFLKGDESICRIDSILWRVWTNDVVNINKKDCAYNHTGGYG